MKSIIQSSGLLTGSELTAEYRKRKNENEVKYVSSGEVIPNDWEVTE